MKELFEKAKLLGHARGLIFFKVTQQMLKIMWPQGNNINADFKSAASILQAAAGLDERKRRMHKQAAFVREYLSEITKGAEWCGGDDVDPVWKRRFLRGHYEDLRNFEITLAFSTFAPEAGSVPTATAAAAAAGATAAVAAAAGQAAAESLSGVSKIPRFKCVGFCTHRTADPNERTFTNPQVEAINQNGKLLIIDLICAHEGLSGVASSLINFVLAEQFSRISRGNPKYLGAYAYLVVGGTPAQPAGQVAPGALQNVMNRIGFRTVTMNPRPDYEYHGRFIEAKSQLFVQNLDAIFAPLKNPCVVGRSNGMRKCI